MAVLMKNIDGVDVPCTPEEQAAIEAEWAATAALPKPQAADIVENDIANNRALRAIVTVLATRFGITRAQLITAIRNAAT